MTREEAIKTIKENLCGLCNYGFYSMESCNISSCDNRDAIEVLEQELSEDCISKQAAIDILDDYQVMIENGERNPYAWARQQMSELPSIQPGTARRIVRKSMDGMILWYQCDMCNEPVDKQDAYCCGCGRRFVDE